MPLLQFKRLSEDFRIWDKLAAGGYIMPEAYKAKKKAIPDSM